MNIPQGVKVDVEDKQRVLLYGKWHIDHKGYVRINKQVNGKQFGVRLHRFILELNDKEKRQVDHINGDKLDNRKSNLRLVTNSQNQMNKRPQRKSKSGQNGVIYLENRKRWLARIRRDGRLYHIGYYADLDEAVAARLKAENSLFGEYSYARR